ncbi:MAG: zinc dependent phospholipase C family protein [Bacillota bacterium]|nr:zinc dependent phospholipase C family protein [Bacillota bacterium]
MPNLKRLATASYATVARLALTVASPMQYLVDRAGDTHAFLDRQAITILRNDGYRQWADLLHQWEQYLLAGTYYADRGWKNASHHYNPRTGAGLWHLPSAADECCRYAAAAAASWRAGYRDEAIFWLGAALHLVQDVCEPHHASALVLHGHQRFETWADRNKALFTVWDQGIYHLGSSPAEWVVANARAAQPFLPLVAGKKASEESYTAAARVLLPLAQRTGAGFLAFFLESVCTQVTDQAGIEDQSNQARQHTLR